MLENKVPPPVVALVCAGGMKLISAHSPVLAAPDPARRAAAGVLAAAGLGVAVAGLLSFKKAGTTANPLKPETATALVTGGIYRFTRNPMYLGVLTMLLAWAVWLAAPAALLGAAAFWAYIGRFQIGPEERVLERLFGREYADYCARAPRWL